MTIRTGLSSRFLGASAFVLAWVSAGAALAQSEPEATAVDDIVVTAQLREQSAREVPFALTAYSGDTLDALGIQEFDQLSAFVPGFVVQNQSPNNPGFVMRGITSDSGESTVEPRVSVFQDGVSISKSRGSYVELFDLERIEIAKGPQSTLYGRGALIGAVNLVQNKARIGDSSGETTFEAGDLGYLSYEGYANLPVSDTFALRFSGRHRERDGYVDNLLGGRDYNGIQTNAGRIAARWEPTERFRFDLIGNYQEDEATGTSFKNIAYAPSDPATGAVLGGRAPWEGAALTPTVAFDDQRGIGLEREVWGVTGIGRYDLSEALTLTSTSAYRTFSSYEAFDADGLSLPILSAAEDAEGEQWSQELRLNFDNGGRWSAFVGAGVFREEGSQRAPAQFDERIALAQLAGLLDGNPAGQGTTVLPASVYGSSAVLTPILTAFGLPAPVRPGISANLKGQHLEETVNSSELTSYDLFADVTFAVTDRLEVAAGVRYTTDDKTTGFSSKVLNGRSVLGGLLGVQQLNAQINALIAVGTPAALLQAQQLGVLANGIVIGLATPGAANAPVSATFPLFGLGTQPTPNNGDFVYRDLSDEGVTWRLTARYDLTDDVNLYANYARGRRPEVLSGRSPSQPLAQPTFTEVAAEEVDSFEVGAKGRSLGGVLTWDAAAYSYTYENFQTTIQQGTQFIVTNAGEASAYGFEGQATWAATDSLDLFATYGYNRGRFDNGIFEGNSFRLSPDHKASVGLNWRLALGGGELEVQPTYTWQSKVFFSDDNDRPSLQTANFVPDTTQDELQEDYGLLNLRVRFTPNAGNFELMAFADNLLDEEYVKDAGNTGDALGLPTFIAGRPRTLGAGITLRY